VDNIKTLNKMKKTIWTLFVLIISLEAFSYVPPLINVGSFNNPYELQLGIGAGTNGLEPRLGFSINDNSYLFLNGTFSVDSIKVYDYKSKHFWAEGGYVYAHKIGNHFRIMGSAGYAFGEMGSYQKVYSNNYDDNYYIDFINYNGYTFTAHRFFVAYNLGLSFKYVQVYFGAKVTIGNYLGKGDYKNTKLLSQGSFEPNLTFKVGLERVKFVAQFRQSADSFNNFSESLDLPFGNVYFSFGLELNTQLFGKKNNTKP